MFSAFFLATTLALTPQTLSSIIENNAKLTNIDPQLMIAIAYHESHFNLKALSDSKKDHGVFQIRFGAATRGFKLHKKDLFDPEINTVLATMYMQDQLQLCGTLPKALGAYSSGHCIVNSYSKRILHIYSHLTNPKNSITKRKVYEALLHCDEKMLHSVQKSSESKFDDGFSLKSAQLNGSL